MTIDCDDCERAANKHLSCENVRLRRERIEQEAMNLEIAGLIRKADARCAEILGFYGSTLVRLECVRRDLDEARAEVARRDALIKSDGYEDMRQHAQDLALQLEATRLDRDRALVRCREASQILIEAIGANGPENVEETAKRAAEHLAAERQKTTDVLSDLAEVAVAHRMAIVELETEGHADDCEPDAPCLACRVRLILGES